MSWITPLGLPVIQPYRQSAKKTVRTLLQLIVLGIILLLRTYFLNKVQHINISLFLAIESDDLPVSSRKQKSAFPPNFVCSSFQS